VAVKCAAALLVAAPREDDVVAVPLAPEPDAEPEAEVLLDEPGEVALAFVAGGVPACLTWNVPEEAKI